MLLEMGKKNAKQPLTWTAACVLRGILPDRAAPFMLAGIPPPETKRVELLLDPFRLPVV